MLPAASLAAYVIARYPFKGRELVYGLFTLGLLFPVAVAILPLFIMLRQVGLLSNPLGVALPQAAFGLPDRDHRDATVLPRRSPRSCRTPRPSTGAVRSASTGR